MTRPACTSVIRPYLPPARAPAPTFWCRALAPRPPAGTLDLDVAAISRIRYDKSAFWNSVGALARLAIHALTLVTLSARTRPRNSRRNRRPRTLVSSAGPVQHERTLVFSRTLPREGAIADPHAISMSDRGRSFALGGEGSDAAQQPGSMSRGKEGRKLSTSVCSKRGV